MQKLEKNKITHEWLMQFGKAHCALRRRIFIKSRERQSEQFSLYWYSHWDSRKRVWVQTFTRVYWHLFVMSYREPILWVSLYSNTSINILALKTAKAMSSYQKRAYGNDWLEVSGNQGGPKYWKFTTKQQNLAHWLIAIVCLCACVCFTHACIRIRVFFVSIHYGVNNADSRNAFHRHLIRLWFIPSTRSPQN